MTHETDADDTTDEEMTQVSVLVPETTKEAAKEHLEHGGLTREIRACLTRVANGNKLTEDSQPSDKEQLRQQLKAAREELRDYRNKREHYKTRVSSQETRVARLEERLIESDADNTEVDQ